MGKSKHRKGHKQKVQVHKQKVQNQRTYVKKLTEELERAIASADVTQAAVQTTLTPLTSTEIKL